MLLVGCQLIADAKIHLDCVADRIEASVSACLDHSALTVLLDRHTCGNAVFLLEIALRHIKYIFDIDVIPGKYLIDHIRCQLFVSVIGYTFDQITDFLFHLIRQGHAKVLF